MPLHFPSKAGASLLVSIVRSGAEQEAQPGSLGIDKVAKAFVALCLPGCPAVQFGQPSGKTERKESFNSGSRAETDRLSNFMKSSVDAKRISQRLSSQASTSSCNLCKRLIRACGEHDQVTAWAEVTPISDKEDLSSCSIRGIVEGNSQVANSGSSQFAVRLFNGKGI